MMFRKQYLAILLSSIGSASLAFSPAPVGRSTFLNTQNTQRSSVEEHTSLLVSAKTFQLNVVSDAADEVSEAADPVEKPQEQKEEDDISCVAYVVNLAYDTDYVKLREVFSATGAAVKKVFVPRNRDTGRNKGIAFVTMESEEARDAAIAALNESEVDGRTIYVDKAKPRGEVAAKKEPLTKLYVGNISYDTTAEDLEGYFSEYGEVSNVYIPVDRYNNQPRGFAFLAMKPEEAESAIEAFDGTEMDGRTIEVKVSLPRGMKGPKRKNETKIYVGNMSFDTEEQTLRSLFEEYGPIIDLYIPYDNNTGRPRGFAFVSLEPDNAVRAIEELDSVELDGRMLRVNEAQPKGTSGGGYNNENEGVSNEW